VDDSGWWWRSNRLWWWRWSLVLFFVYVGGFLCTWIRL
jgi:hypothetical protein